MSPGLARLACAAILALPSFGCLTLEPVHESIEVSFAKGGGCTVVAEARIEGTGEPGAEAPPPELARRLARLRDELGSGDDDVARAFAAAPAERLRVARDWARGELAERRLEAALPVAALPDLLAGAGIEAWVTEGDGWRELTLRGAAAARGTREQRELVDATLDRFAGALHRHALAMGALHERLELQPGRAGEAYAALLEEPPPAPEGTLEAATREAAASLEALGDFFFVESGDAGRSLDSLTRLVMDPFPADLAIRAPDVLESEGFLRDGDALRAPAVSLGGALRSLEGRWAEPDVAVAVVDALLRGDEPDLAALASLPRRATPPLGLDEVRDALRAALARPPSVRVRWASGA